MVKNFKSNFDLNKFFKEIVIKKEYKKIIIDKTCLLNKLKDYDYKKLNFNIYLKNKNFIKYNNLVMYIIDISFLCGRVLLHVMDSSGVLKFFCSVGAFSYKIKNKKVRNLIFKIILQTIIQKIQKLEFIQAKPVSLHIQNLIFFKKLILNMLKPKIFIKVVRNFVAYPHNGCRKKKIRRKRFKKSRSIQRKFL